MPWSLASVPGTKFMSSLRTVCTLPYGVISSSYVLLLKYTNSDKWYQYVHWWRIIYWKILSIIVGNHDIKYRYGSAFGVESWEFTYCYKLEAERVKCKCCESLKFPRPDFSDILPLARWHFLNLPIQHNQLVIKCSNPCAYTCLTNTVVRQMFIISGSYNLSSSPFYHDNPWTRSSI